jgi:biofilm PGA synthesis N-glycosyltransferase PgaC
MWQVLFWMSAGFIFYIYFGYPTALYILGKFYRKPKHSPESEYWPSVCLIISAFNEEKILRSKIENSIGLDYPKERFRILVASDGSTDRTNEIAGDYEDLGVSLWSFPVRRGKSAVLNEVMRHVTEEIIVFTDANALFEEDALVRLVKHFANPEIGCVVGKLRYIDRHTSCVGKGESIYWRYESRISRLESVLRSVLVANGSIFAIRGRLFKELYPEVANDFQLPAEIANQGYGVIYDPRAEAVERSTIFWQEEFQRKIRIILRGMTGFMMLGNSLKGFRLWQFISHKLLRWMVGLFLMITLISNVFLIEKSWFYTSTLAAQVLFYLAAFNGWRLRKAKQPGRIFYVPFYFTMVNLAAVVGIFKFIAGHRQRVWDKAESARFAPSHSPNGSTSQGAAEESSEGALGNSDAKAKMGEN